VTFSKVPKRKRGDSVVQTEQIGDPPESSVQSGPEVTTPQTRIVSHSQQSTSVPQVIFEHNRHIIPDNLFRVATTQAGPAQRSPHSRDPRRLSHSRPLNPIESISRDTSPRPNIRTWGSTRVNRRLQEQVLREVFAPPVIHRHKHHTRHHLSNGEMPTQPASLGTASPVATYQRTRAEIQQTFPDPAFVTEESNDSSLIGAPLTLSRTAPDDPDFIEQRPISSSNSATSSSRTVRRRHSGSGLRRRPIDVLSGTRSGLEFHEEDGYGADQEDEVFTMDNDDEPRGTASASSTTTAQLGSPIRQLTSTSIQEERPTTQDDARGTLTRQPSEAPSQGQTDARVEMFILLEDLTARMERPCVLDLKMGTRQYGVEADEKKQRSQRRKCQMTTSRALGVRVCGMQVWNIKTQSYLFEDKYFGRDLKAGAEFQAALARFFFDGQGYSSARRYIPVILDQLSKLERIARHLHGYRFYASSLLIIYDRAAEDNSTDGSSSPPSPPDPVIAPLPHKLERASSGPPIHHIDQLSPPPRKIRPCPIKIKIVDFANCVTKEDTSRLEQATIPPQNPDGVDRGYLRGIRTLKLYFQRIWKEVAEVDWEERGEIEGELEGRKGAWNDAALGWEDPGDVSV
jgi:inositol-hexakisphosphate kinase